MKLTHEQKLKLTNFLYSRNVSFNFSIFTTGVIVVFTFILLISKEPASTLTLFFYWTLFITAPPIYAILEMFTSLSVFRDIRGFTLPHFVFYVVIEFVIQFLIVGVMSGIYLINKLFL